jgi:hypothetical protein
MGRDKKPKPDTMELWFKKVQGYQETEIIEAFEDMKDTLDSVPFNIPKAIKRAVVAVNMSKCSNKVAWQNYGPCEGCKGSGAFTVLDQDKFGNRYTFMQFCSQCDNWRNYVNDPRERISANELTGAGYIFKPFNKVLRVSPKKAVGAGSVEGINNLANQVVKRM